MVRTQDIAHFATPIVEPLPSIDHLPAAVVAIVLLASALTLLLVSFRRRDAE